jgi:hypothetical protein
MNEIQIVYDWLINHFRNSELVNTFLMCLHRNGSKQRNISIHLLIYFLIKHRRAGNTFNFQNNSYSAKRYATATNNKLMTDTNYLDNVNETGMYLHKIL